MKRYHWIAVDEDGTEIQFLKKPDHRNGNVLVGGFWHRAVGNYFYLKEGTIEKLIGRKLTWDDEPVKIKL